MKNKRTSDSCAHDRRNAMKAIVTVATVGATGALQNSVGIKPVAGIKTSGVRMERGWILRGSDS